MNYLEIIFIIVAIFIIIILFVCNRFFDLTLTRGKKNILESMKDDSKEDKETVEEGDNKKIEDTISKEEIEAWFSEVKKDDLFIINKENMKLHGYFIKNKNDMKKYAIIVHGYNGEALQMSGFAKKFYDMGFNTLLPDLRAHGESGGKVRGMGYLDRLDILLWIDYILSLEKDAFIILFGISMGASTVMMTSGEKLPKNVKLIIEDSGYSSVAEEFSYKFKKKFHAPKFPFIQIFSFITKVRGGYFIEEADIVKYLVSCKLPTLFIHGHDDDFVPFYMLDKLYNAAKCEREKLVVYGARHCEASSVDGVLYWETVKNFLDKYLK